MSYKRVVSPNEKRAAPTERLNTVIAYLAIFGMECSRCATSIRNSLLGIYGVRSAEVEYVMRVSRVVFVPNLTEVPALMEAVVRAGTGEQHKYGAMLLDLSEPLSAD